MTSRRANKKATTGDDHATGTPELSEDGQKIVDAITMQLDVLRNEFKLKLEEKDRQRNKKPQGNLNYT